MPIDFMFRIICFGDSSNAKIRHFSPFLQIFSANCTPIYSYQYRMHLYKDTAALIQTFSPSMVSKRPIPVYNLFGACVLIVMMLLAVLESRLHPLKMDIHCIHEKNPIFYYSEITCRYFINNRII